MASAARDNRRRGNSSLIQQMRKIQQRHKRGGIRKAPINPLVRGWEKTKEIRKEWTPEDFKGGLANAQILDTNIQLGLVALGLPVTLSKDAHLDESELVEQRLDEEAKQILELLIACFGQPNDAMIKEGIDHMRNPTKQNREQ